MKSSFSLLLLKGWIWGRWTWGPFSIPGGSNPACLTHAGSPAVAEGALLSVPKAGALQAWAMAQLSTGACMWPEGTAQKATDLGRCSHPDSAKSPPRNIKGSPCSCSVTAQLVVSRSPWQLPCKYRNHNLSKEDAKNKHRGICNCVILTLPYVIPLLFIVLHLSLFLNHLSFNSKNEKNILCRCK